MLARRSPLFSAVVLAGVSLTGAALTAACGDDDHAPSGPGADASSGASSSGGTTSEAGTDSSSNNDAGACPPGSEIPSPPCVLIK